MKCPKCFEGEVQQQTSIIGIFFKKKKVITFCPLCDFLNEHIFELSKHDIELETFERANKKISERICKSERREGRI